MSLMLAFGFPTFHYRHADSVVLDLPAAPIVVAGFHLHSMLLADSVVSDQLVHPSCLHQIYYFILSRAWAKKVMEFPQATRLRLLGLHGFRLTNSVPLSTILPSMASETKMT